MWYNVEYYNKYHGCWLSAPFGLAHNIADARELREAMLRDGFTVRIRATSWDVSEYLQARKER